MIEDILRWLFPKTIQAIERNSAFTAESAVSRRFVDWQKTESVAMRANIMRELGMIVPSFEEIERQMNANRPTTTVPPMSLPMYSPYTSQLRDQRRAAGEKEQ